MLTEDQTSPNALAADVTPSAVQGGAAAEDEPAFGLEEGDLALSGGGGAEQRDERLVVDAQVDRIVRQQGGSAERLAQNRQVGITLGEGLHRPDVIQQVVGPPAIDHLAASTTQSAGVHAVSADLGVLFEPAQQIADMYQYRLPRPSSCSTAIRSRRPRSATSSRGSERMPVRGSGRTPSQCERNDAWFERYNQRQTIEAGNKEEKIVFALHHLKTRSRSGILLQEQFVAFAANFDRWATLWLTQECTNVSEGWLDPAHPHVKEQVKIGAQSFAWVSWYEQGCMLRFEDHSVFAGRSLNIKKHWTFQPVLSFSKSCFFS